jgi:formylglycine-generating enzyme required for sulfatase activity
LRRNSHLAESGYLDSAARTAPVGIFSESRFGLYDMGGNMQEWCSTWYEASMNEAEVLEGWPMLKDDGGGQTYRVLRGASWFNDGETQLRSSFRYINGFRVVLVLAGI